MLARLEGLLVRSQLELGMLSYDVLKVGYMLSAGMNTVNVVWVVQRKSFER